MNQLAEMMAAGLGREDLKPVYEPPRAGDLKHSFADLKQAESILKYQPIVDLQSGLEATMGWYKSVLG